MSAFFTRRQTLSILGAAPLGAAPLCTAPLCTASAARAWAIPTRQSGQKCMVMTTKHHDGFCLFDSKLTDYCAPKQACGRDLVEEFVKVARAEDRRIGFYYSLMDRHHPDGARCATDETARKRFLAYTHGQIRELLTNYGKIDALWYDASWPLGAKGWEFEKMNRMVFALQPDILCQLGGQAIQTARPLFPRRQTVSIQCAIDS